jgi:hypothetical protein
VVETKSKRVLMVVFEFTPSNGASVQRILSVYKSYLAEGYIVDVLTAMPMAYENVQNETLNLLPHNEHGKIIRAPALDALRHLAYKGKHVSWMASPDRWGKTWIPSATLLGIFHVKKYHPDIIWSSSPTPSPHVIARNLQKKTGAIWIADYRDPMTHFQRSLPDSMGKALQEIDSETLDNADLLTFATDEVAQMYREQRPERNPNDFRTMQNGYDAVLLDEVRRELPSFNNQLMKEDSYNIYYAGVLYKEGRDPIPFFEALAELKQSHPKCPFNVVFQGTKNASDYEAVIKRLGISDVVKFVAGVTFKEAISNMLNADALLLIQDARFNRQIPGKVYEYLATGKTILLKSPSESATSNVALEYQGVHQIDEKSSIYKALCGIVEPFFEQGTSISRIPEWIRETAHHSRQYHAKELMRWSREILSGTGHRLNKLNTSRN